MSGGFARLAAMRFLLADGILGDFTWVGRLETYEEAVLAGCRWMNGFVLLDSLASRDLAFLLLNLFL